MVNDRAECWNCHKRTRIENNICQYCGEELVVLEIKINSLAEMFHRFEYHKEIQEITIKENEVKPFDDNISLKLLKDGSLEVIEQ